MQGVLGKPIAVYLQSDEYSSAHLASPGLNAEWQEA